MTTQSELARLGDALERAAASSLPRRPSRRLVLAAAAIALAVPATVAAVAMTSGDEVAGTLAPGTAMLAGTHPSCTVVRPNVEYHCTLAKAPVPEVTHADGTPALKGTVEPTVDATKHVNGGCRSLNDAGTVWQCYLGEEAVRQQIIGAGFLGEYAPSPGKG